MLSSFYSQHNTHLSPFFSGSWETFSRSLGHKRQDSVCKKGLVLCPLCLAPAWPHASQQTRSQCAVFLEGAFRPILQTWKDTPSVKRNSHFIAAYSLSPFSPVHRSSGLNFDAVYVWFEGWLGREALNSWNQLKHLLDYQLLITRKVSRKTFKYMRAREKCLKTQKNAREEMNKAKRNEQSLQDWL